MKKYINIKKIILFIFTLSFFSWRFHQKQDDSISNKNILLKKNVLKDSLTFTFDNRIVNTKKEAMIIFERNNIDGWDKGLGAIDTNRLKISLPAEAGTFKGMECRIDVEDSDQYQLCFDVKFDKGFSFAKGGKVGFGFAIGKGVSGGRNTETTIDNLGGSFRVMWRSRTDGTSYLHPYVYYKDMKKQFGTDFEKNRFTIVDNTTYKIRLTIKTNTSASLSDGYAKMEVKPEGSNSFTNVWEKKDIRWSGSDIAANRKIKTLYFSTFRGGSNNSWDGTNGTNAIFFDNLVWKKVF